MMEAATLPRDAVAESRLAVRMAPLFATMALGFLSVSLPLPALPLHVRGELGFDTAVAGLVIGIQSLATVLTRIPAGRLVDRRGPKLPLLMGLVICSTAGWSYLASLLFEPAGSLALLILGRLLLGVGESLLITGVLSWAIVRAGPGRAGTAMSWNGMAQYGALALGAPLGFSLYSHMGFAALSTAAALAPMIAVPIVAILRPVEAGRGDRTSMADVFARIWKYGTGLMLGGIGFAAVSAFASLTFADRHWDGAGFALFAYGACFVAVRLAFGGAPDRFGGTSVAAASLAVEALGQAMLWFAPAPAVALIGAGLTGAGCSLIFPAFGIEAFRRVPSESRGIAVGTFAAFQDVAIGSTGPILGLVAARLGTPMVFGFGLVAALAGMIVAMRLRRQN